MLEYWMANNDTTSNGSEFQIAEVLEDPGSAVLFEGYPPWLMYFAAGCCLLFMLIGIPGNLITVAALFRTKKLRNATAVFIMNLSVSDLMFCCFNLPLATSTFWHGSWMHGPLLCRLFPLLRYGLVAVSLFTVLAITINRYVMIGHPRLYPKLYKPKYLVLMVLATWISGFGALVATWFEQWGRFGLDPQIGSCSILPDVNGHSPKEFLFILAFLTPCMAIIVCYARIFYIVRKTALKSRRRNKVTIDLVKASLELKYTKNQEDSAIGSSCGATLTTTENGGSPVKHHEKGNFASSTSPKITDNHADRESFPREENDAQPIERIPGKLKTVQKSASNEDVRESPPSIIPIGKPRTNAADNNPNSKSHSKEVSSINPEEMSESTDKRSIALGDEDSIRDSRNGRSEIPDVQVQGEKVTFGDSEDDSRASSDDEEDIDEDLRSNFERSVEFLPFIDTYDEHSCDGEDDSVLSNSDNVAFRPIPNVQLFTVDSPSENCDNESQPTEEETKDRKDCCLQVPKRFPRCTEKTGNHLASPRIARDYSDKFRESEDQQILNTKSLEISENGLRIPKKFLRDFEYNSEDLLSPQSTGCNNGVSDEYASSRSDSMSERRGSSVRRANIFRRESRFRSVRNRAFESGKMTAKDKKLLKMILVIFSSFLICYLPITITKIFKDVIDWRGLNIAGYILIYLTTCINPVIYVVMSSEYRCAYKNVLLCRSDSAASNCRQAAANQIGNCHERRRKNGERNNSSTN